jgi:lysine 2,3-aminomutase
MAPIMPDGFAHDQRTLRDTDALIAAGLAPESARATLEAVAASYAIAIPPALQALIETPDDPIGRQFIPHPDELRQAPGELEDPIGDDALSPVPGIVHRYPDRVLLKPLLICPTYCRFCFRRAHVGPDGGLLAPAALDAAFAYIDAHPAVREVILTGGDPLMLSPRRLRAIIARLSVIPHIELIRIHTRVPVADPALLTASLADALETDRGLFVVVHVNHPRELTQAAAAALKSLTTRGIPLLSQSVLLRGVNDDVETLSALFRTLLKLRIKPYYLHQLDPAVGTARFAVPMAEGKELMASLRGQISGHALPTYVFDTIHGKVPIASR